MDYAILKWFAEIFHSIRALNYVMKYITYIGEFGIAAILLAVTLLCFKKTRRAGIAVAIALILDLIIVNVILKLTINRPRPWVEYPMSGFHEFHLAIGVREPLDSSFPSGHTASLFAVASALFLQNKKLAIPAIIVASLVAISRVYLCMHYPSDVLGGAVVGTLCGIAAHFSEIKLRKSFIKQENSFN